MSTNIELNSEFETAYNLMEFTNLNLFLTGKAGTGKSTLLKYFREKTKKNVVVLAPTGIAAINVKGQTIHSFFGFPPHPINTDTIRKRKNNQIYSKINTIVIDEISMVRADIIDGIDYFMRLNGNHKSLPFGGVQMIFIGDMFQLPPVISSDIEKQMFAFLYKTPYFFSANALFSIKLKVIELQKVYRQNDAFFLQLLDNIRTNNFDDYCLQHINKQVNMNFNPPNNDYFITLASTNAIAQKINETKLNQINEIAYKYVGEIEGNFDSKSYPNDMDLQFKEGAQVMFVRNDLTHRWVNGTIGKITYLSSDTISVKINTEKGEVVHNVERSTWEIVKYNFDEAKQKITTEIIGSFTQFPLKLAWAITIHKSQGKTFEKIIIDLGSNAFATGQVYVALSRCTTLEGIVLKRKIKPYDIKVDENIIAFMNQLKQNS